MSEKSPIHRSGCQCFLLHRAMDQIDPVKSLGPYRERAGRQRPRHWKECAGPERSRYGDLY